MRHHGAPLARGPVSLVASKPTCLHRNTNRVSGIQVGDFQAADAIVIPAVQSPSRPSFYALPPGLQSGAPWVGGRSPFSHHLKHFGAPNQGPHVHVHGAKNGTEYPVLGVAQHQNPWCLARRLYCGT
ncbi:hypothetical protein BT67DRAFT_437906 [Trichocladium antarcticum]|uniref:Uncharacterized protein n=1 Tax=Trichocladium antarcticum TaxID=1450529 RepID=A0AAN6USS9_9PEZI|nr:hypothetical protein BT67DRAFT_437906 [Trichocladium antarcticum]